MTGGITGAVDYAAVICGKTKRAGACWVIRLCKAAPGDHARLAPTQLWSAAGMPAAVFPSPIPPPSVGPRAVR